MFGRVRRSTLLVGSLVGVGDLLLAGFGAAVYCPWCSVVLFHRLCCCIALLRCFAALICCVDFAALILLLRFTLSVAAHGSLDGCCCSLVWPALLVWVLRISGVAALLLSAFLFGCAVF